MPRIERDRGLREHDDRKLVARIRQRDASALSALFRHYYPRVHHFAMRRLRSTKRAEAVADEVFFEVWRSVEAFRGGSAVSSWIFGIAHFKCAGARSARERTRDGSKERDMTVKCPEGVLTLIPWYRELDGDDRGIVEAHAAGCAACRSEVEMVSGGAVPPTPFPDRDALFAKLLTRIESTERRGRDQPQQEQGWRFVAFAAAALLLVALGFAAAQLPWFRAPFSAAISVSSAPPITSLNVVFHENVSPTEIERALTEFGAVLVSGPTPSGRYRVAVPPNADPRRIAGLLTAKSRQYPDGIATFAVPLYR